MRSIVYWLFCVFAAAAPLFPQTAPLTITTGQSLPNGNVNSSYNTTLSSTGGTGAARTWAVISGTLPAGLNLSGSTATATISGTPTAFGSFSFTVRVTNPAAPAQTDTEVFFVFIQPLPLVITSASPLPNATTTVNYLFNLTATGGATPYIGWDLVSGTLPPGLTGSPSGSISGTPTTAGVYTFVVGVEDNYETRATKQFTLTVTVPVLTITTNSPAPNGLVGVPYSLNFAVTNGTSPYTWTLASGNLPTGLTLSTGGALTGTPTTPANFSFTIRVSDSPPQSLGAQVTTKAFTLLITAPLTVTTVSPMPATAGSPLTVVMTAIGGRPPYLFFAAPGSQLPAGFTLDAGSGFLSGTPAAVGNFNFTVQVSDSAQNNATKALVLAVAPPLSIPTSSPAPGGTVGASYSVAFATAGGNAPHTWALDSGTLPAGLTLNTSTGVVSGSPQTAGTFAFVIRVTDAAKATITKPFSLTIAPQTPQGVLISTTSLEFSAFAGGDSPAPQGVTLISAGAQPVQFTVLTDGGAAGTPAPSWLTVKLLRGSTPASIPVIVNPASLTPGKYTSRILINSTNIVTVNLTVEAGTPTLDVSPAYLKYTGAPNGSLLFEQNLLLRNVGGGGAVTFRATPVEGAAWLTIRDGFGQLTPNSPAVMPIIASTQGLPRGPRRGLIRVESSAGNVDIPVTLLVQDDGPLLGLNLTGLRFEAREGNGNANTRNANVLNLGQGTVSWRAELVSGAEWFSLGDTSGVSTPSTPSRLAVSANPGAFPPGNYYGLVRVTDPAAASSPQFLTLVLGVTSADTPALPDPSPSGLFFSGRIGAAPPAAQVIRVFTSSTATVPFQASANTSDGGAWLSISPTSGVTSTQGAAQVTATVNLAGLLPGIYTGDVTFAFSTTQIRTTNITLVVLPALASLASRSAAGCAPARLSVTQTGLVNSFAAPAGWPTPLIVRLADDCGDPVLNGQVVATFSNGDPALVMRLTVPENGLYSTTWSPTGVAGAVTVSARATAANLQAATAIITGAVTPNRAPALKPNNVVNNLNGRNGDPLAPGMVAQVHGSALATSTVSPDVLPLQKAFNGTRVLIGALEAPLYFLSDGQLNVQIPTELAPDKEYSIVVEAIGGLTLPDTLTLGQAQPGVAAFANQTVIAQHSDATASLVTATAPAAQGEALTIYLVGMGATNPAVPSSSPSPSAEPLARVTAQPTVTIGGRNATLIYAGLTPRAVGLYQINFFVPSGSSGNLPLVITQNGVSANATVLPVR